MGAARRRPAKAMQFLVLHCQPIAGSAQARWSELDLESGIWNVPAERMKARRPHRVPLAPEVVALLRGLHTESDSDLVFLGSQAGKPLAHTSLQLLRAHGTADDGARSP